MVNFNNKRYGIDYESKSRLNNQNFLGLRDKQDKKHVNSETKVALGATLGLSLITFTTAAGLYYFGSGKKNFKLKDVGPTTKTLDDMIDFISTGSQNSAPEFFEIQVKPPKDVCTNIADNVSKWKTITTDYAEQSVANPAKTKPIADSNQKLNEQKKNK